MPGLALLKILAWADRHRENNKDAADFYELLASYELAGVRFERLSPPAVYASVGNTMYDIDAKAEGDTPPARAEFRLMLQALLADRFKLQSWVERTARN